MSDSCEYVPGRLAEGIEGQVPYDGPHSPEKVTDAAHGLYALVRYMNNATFAGRVLPTASTVDEVLGGLSAALDASDQLLRQLQDALRSGAAGEDVYDDRDSRDPEAGQEALSQLVRDIGDLRVRLSQAGDTTHVCRASSAHLGNRR